MEDKKSNFLSSFPKMKSMPHTLVLEHVSPATRLLEKRRQMFEVQENLETQKVEFNRKEEVLKRREEGLKKKDLELQESLIRFSKFLQENDSKRTRAEKEAIDEIKLRLSKERDIGDLSRSLAKLQAERDTTSEVADANLRYQKFLEVVLETSDEYQEIGDLLMRHATLEATNNDLRQHARECAELNEQTRAELQAYTKSKADEILNLNNRMSRLKKEMEGKERETMGHEMRKDYAVQTASQKTLQHGQVTMAMENLFLRCRESSKVNHPQYTSPMEQLNVIGDFMTDLAAIVKQGRAEKKGRPEGAAGLAK